MNTIQHSPGPWRAGGYKNIIVNSAGGFTICLAPSGSDCAPIEEIQANARLIAAAPDLLQVVEDYLLLCKLHDYVGAVPDAARAAISKAKGGE